LVHNKSNANDFPKRQKALIDRIDRDLAQLKLLDAETTTTGEAGKVDTKKRVDLHKRLEATKRALEDAQAATRDLTEQHEDMFDLAREQQLNAADEVEALKHDIAEAKKPFAERMREVHDGVADHEKRLA